MQLFSMAKTNHLLTSLKKIRRVFPDPSQLSLSFFFKFGAKPGSNDRTQKELQSAIFFHGSKYLK